MDFYSLVSGLAGGGVVGLIAAVIAMVAIGYVRRLIAKNDDLMERQTTEFRHQLRAIGARLDAHIREDRSQAILNELKNITAAQASQNALTAAMSGEIKKLLVSDAEQRGKLESLDRYIKGVDDDLREHKRNHNHR